MDPLVERRELVRNVHLHAKDLKRNIEASLLAQLRHQHEGRCVSEGYLMKRSLTVVEHSLGRMNLIRGGLDYVVKFQADVCLPHPGQHFRVPVVLKSKIGLHAELSPLKILLPRDLHIGNGEFDEAAEGQEVEIEVVGSRFQQGDEAIVVLATLRSLIRPEAPKTATDEIDDTLPPLIAAPVDADGADAKRVVTVDLASTKATEGSARRKRLRPNAEGKTNEPVSA
jgi:DNA-directed RNA polymerase subunit E'/Rpb7